MQQQTGFIIDDNEVWTDWQKFFSEDIHFSDSEKDFPQAVAFLEQNFTSRDSEMGISPLNKDKICPKRGALYCTEIRPRQCCKNLSCKMQDSIEKAVSGPGSITTSSSRQISKSSSSENCYVSHLNNKLAEMLPENKNFPHLANKLLKTCKECSRANFIENELIMNRENEKQGRIYFNNLDTLKLQCESASEISISSQDSSNSQAMASQISSTEEMFVSSQESITRDSSEKMNISQEKEDMAVSSQETIARDSNEKMNISQENEDMAVSSQESIARDSNENMSISQEKEDMAVSSQECMGRDSIEKMNISQEKEDMTVSSQQTLIERSIGKEVNISQEKENPKTNILGQENCEKPEDIRIKVGQCSFFTTSLSKTLSKNTSHILHLENFNKMEFLKSGVSTINVCSVRKSRRRYSKVFKNNRCSNIVQRELRVAKRETILRIRRKLLAMKEVNILRREKILEAKEKKYRIYEESI